MTPKFASVPSSRETFSVPPPPPGGTAQHHVPPLRRMSPCLTGSCVRAAADARRRVRRVSLVRGLFEGRGSKSLSLSVSWGSPARAEPWPPRPLPLSAYEENEGPVAGLAPGGLDLVVTPCGLPWAFCRGPS